jgi:Co/Zn/Cd efflux system component
MYNKMMKKLRFCFNLNHTIDRNCYFCERNALFIAFLLNFIIFGVELVYGIIESSAALLSDSGHNVGDAVILGSSVFFLSASITSKAKLAIVKCVFWVFFGGLALYHAFLNIQTGSIPSHFLVGSIGIAALIVNISTVIFMSGFKDDDINIKSAYICCRNDAIGNLLIILSAYLVYLWGTNWPDVFVGLIIASLMFVSAYNIAKESYGLIKTGNHPVKFTKKD